MEVTLDLPPNGSMFVVFQKAAPASSPEVSRQRGAAPAPVAINGAWTADFVGGPRGVAFPQLVSWTAHAQTELRSFAGTGRYRTTFRLPANWRKEGFTPFVDLGRLWTIGEVWLNGKPLGVAWTAPFRVDASSALREGENELVVEVTNTWFNRLIGDAKLPAEQRVTRTNVTVSGGKPWAQLEPRDSGLFGPVRLVAEVER